jgi:hypothetical protein
MGITAKYNELSKLRNNQKSQQSFTQVSPLAKQIG